MKKQRKAMLAVAGAAIVVVATSVFLSRFWGWSSSPRAPELRARSSRAARTPAVPPRSETTQPLTQRIAASPIDDRDDARVVDDREPPAVSVGGVRFPDLGNGNPFDLVAVTQAEGDQLFELFDGFQRALEALDAMEQRGEITLEDHDKRVRLTAEGMNLRVIGVLGEERTELLAELLQEYYAEMLAAADEGTLPDVPGIQAAPLIRSIRRRWERSSGGHVASQ